MENSNKKTDIAKKARHNLENRKIKKNNNHSERLLDKWYIRIILIVCALLLLTLFLIINLFNLQVLKGDGYRKEGENKYFFENYIPARRGKISTQDGQLLAYDEEKYFVSLDPSVIKEENIDRLLEMLKIYIEDLDEEKVRDDYFYKKKLGKKYLRPNYIFGEDVRQAILKEIDAAKLQTIENNKKEKDKSKKKTNPFAGVNFETVYKRKYENTEIFQETVGFLNSENKGVYGIEKFYDSELAGKMGIIKTTTKIPKAFFNEKTIEDKGESRPPKDGNNLILTIDSQIQNMLDNEMKRTFYEYDAASTMGILMEVETGKILAMSSYPKSNDHAKIKNRVMTDLFEPGSIFKPIIMSMGLQTKAINANSKISSSGSIRVYDRTISDHDGAVVSGDLETIIARSGNVAMVKIAQMINNKTFYNYLASIGLGSKTGIDIFAELTQKLFPFKQLTEVKKANVAFGQGIAMTQIQMMMALNTVINNGKLMRPYIVEKIEDENGNTVKKNEPIVLRKIFDDEVSRLNRKYMEAVVNRGTGMGAKIEGYRVGGKTGTAQKSGRGGYQKGKYFSSFFAFFPADKPKYAILVTINEPKSGKYYGAEVALPSVKKVLSDLIAYKRIGPNGETAKDPSIKEVVIEEKKKDLNKIKDEFSKNIMPDLNGIVLRDFYSIYPQNKYPNLKVSGSGKIVSQYPQAGTTIDGKTDIQIIFQ